MELNSLLVLLAILVCPISMGIMMWWMNKNMDDRHTHMNSDDSTHAAPGKSEKSDMPLNAPGRK